MASYLILMILLHIIDDFVLQTKSLANLKQKKWWKKQKLENPIQYKDDYLCALFIHGLSWSAMVHIPFLFVYYNDLTLIVSFISQAIIHAIIDNKKANKGEINLIEDQAMHLVQLMVIWLTFTF